MGKSGVGKTTLLNLIMGFLTPNLGEIYFNNNINLKVIDNYKSIIFGYLPQQVNLLKTSILENIIRPALIRAKAAASHCPDHP